MSSVTSTTHRNLLSDITNNSKLSFGDSNAVELVKNRQRKIFKDIAHFKNAINEIEKEIQHLNNKLIPDIIKLSNKKHADMDAMKGTILQCKNDIEETSMSIDTLQRNNELENNNLQLAHSIKMTTVENDLEQIKFNCIKENEAQLNEVENMKPDENMIEEMNILQEQLIEVTKELNEVESENKKICEEYDKSGPVVTEYEQFKINKTQEMNELLKEQELLQNKHSGIQEEWETGNLQVETLSKELDGILERIATEESQIKDTVELNETYTKTLRQYTLQYQSVTTTLDDITSQHDNYNKKDKLQTGKLLREQRLRKKLSVSIAQINQKIPIVKYTDMCPSTNGHPLTTDTINFNNNPLIKNITRLIEYEIQPLYEIYDNKHRDSITIMHVSSEKTPFLVDFMNFLSDNYSSGDNLVEVNDTNTNTFIPINEYDNTSTHQDIIRFKLTGIRQFFKKISLIIIDSLNKMEDLSHSIATRNETNLTLKELMTSTKSIVIFNTNYDTDNTHSLKALYKQIESLSI
ncbi:hypothetical protein C6P45_005283 [Maudiozyma exigua]|uniref:Spindle pole body-associated protein Vik1/Cik1 microtubule binding domain-containing protein n=1 Tax=Maudiozyma exigua TaxID=34358 RepID=A0A9P7BDB5_MAUEX|nr:hypothetical protein C6P45_005283 [Kazachstania exigua]